MGSKAARQALLSTAIAILAGLAIPAEGRLTRLHILSRDTVPASKIDDRPYEIIKGTFEAKLDPRDARNAIITDLANAPRNQAGLVAYSATFEIARPLERPSGVLFYDVPNRGNGQVGPDEDGHARVISGWQGDLTPQPGTQTAQVPTAKGANGTPLTGPVFARFMDMPAGATTLPIVGGIGRAVARPEPVSLDTRRARLFHQASDVSPQVDVPADQWAFADCSSTPFPGTPDPHKICLKGGFDPALAYGLGYEGKDPKVLGIGFAATRDLNSFLRYRTVDDAGTANPLAGTIRWTVIAGTSQSGNYVKSFINLGFNADENGKIVFDGANPNIAGRQVPLNFRFAVPGGAASLYELGSEGTLWWSRYNDKTRGRGVHSLLDRCSASRTCPKIIETFGSTEIWGLRISPEMVGTDAMKDVPLAPNVRRYYFPSVTHGGSATGGISLDGEKAWPGAPSCRLPGNPNPTQPTMRTLLKRLVAWVQTGKEPPASAYPTIAKGDLVKPNAKAMGWPAIPGQPSPDGMLNEFINYDAGPTFRHLDLSGVPTIQPPGIIGRIPSLVPRVNADGNETAGVPSVQLLVPLGTYTGWNVLQRGYGAGSSCGFAGGFIPFATTISERLSSNDPRPSLEERYGTHDGFVARVREVAAQQVAQGWLLPDDAARLIAQADASPVLRRAQ
ncbi:MAG: hypothetical protein J7498_10840 [Sphingobium sp.]|nr:hypothetical protein [Sphingobium sp.]